MPYKDPAKRREYMRKHQPGWIKKRREAYLADKSCEVCGSTERLRISGARIHGGSLWSLSEEKRNEVLKDARILCDHHSRLRMDPVARGLGLTKARSTWQNV